tara:strand:+ start:3252 stop:3767 length:516 start_codon:yes stop_codon:yes gene_type:complete
MVITRSSTASLPASLHICVTLSSVLDALGPLFQDFTDNFDENGNDFLFPIQQQRNARQLIGGGSIENALLILIRSHLDFHGDTILFRGSRAICGLYGQEAEYNDYSWQTEGAIAGQIIQDFPNVETVEDFINDNELLSLRIHEAAQDYCADAPHPDLPAQADDQNSPQFAG